MAIRLPSHLWKSRHGVYYFRRVISEEFRSVFADQAEIRKSLQTRCPKQAILAVQELNLLFDRIATVNKNKEWPDLKLITHLETITSDGTKWFKTVIDTGTPEGDALVALKLGIGVENGPQASQEALQGHFTLRQLVDLYFETTKLKSAVRESTLRDYRAKAEMLIDVLGGETDCQSISLKEINEFEGIIKSLPPNRNKTTKYQGKSLREIAQIASVKKLDSQTINKILGWTSGLFKFAVQHGHMKTNPAYGKVSKKKIKASEERERFSAVQLSQLFGSAGYSQIKLPSRYWAPIVGLYSGLRLGEIVQLKKEDIVTEGIAHIVVKQGEGQSLKNPNAKRLVPVHPKLKELGFLEYVDSPGLEADNYIFPEVNSYSQKLSSPCSNWFRRFRRTVGIPYPDGPDFHSFRHTFIDELKQRGIAEEVIIELAGHQHQNMSMERYGKALNLKKKLEAVSSIDLEIDIPRYAGF